MTAEELDLLASDCGCRIAYPGIESGNVEEGQNHGVQRSSHGLKLLALAVTVSIAHEMKLVAVFALVGSGAGRIWTREMLTEELVCRWWGSEQLQRLLPPRPRPLRAEKRLVEDEVGTTSLQSAFLQDLLRRGDSHVPWICRARFQNAQGGLKFGVDEAESEVPTRNPVRVRHLLGELLAEQENTCLWPGPEEVRS